MNHYPIEPTFFPISRYQKSFHDYDFFYSADGDGYWPEHHCKITWKLAEPYCAQLNNQNAIDVGCRDGEFTRYLQFAFQHVYCFDPRPMQRFADNVDLKKVTHFTCALGDKIGPISMSGGQHNLTVGTKHLVDCFTLDSFSLNNIGIIKIDVEGFEKKVLLGGKKTIIRNKPIIIIEQNDITISGEKKFSALKWLENMNYKLVAKCPRGWDHILIHR